LIKYIFFSSLLPPPLQMLSNASLPSLPPALQKAKRSADSSSKKSSSKRQKRSRKSQKKSIQSDEGQASKQINKLTRRYQPIIQPEDYVVPFKQNSTLHELFAKYAPFIEMLNRIYCCTHCGISYKSITNFRYYGCAFHPGITEFDSIDGVIRYTCCGAKYPDRGLGCTPCMHSRNSKGRERIVHDRNPVCLPEELVDVALEEGGAIFAGHPTDAQRYMARMSKTTPYYLPEQFVFTVCQEMISYREDGKCCFQTSLFALQKPHATSQRHRRSLLNK